MAERPWLKHYDPGVPHSIDYPAVPLFSFLEESARKYPDKPCTLFKGATITYAEMDALTDRLAAGLAEIGVKKGTPVGLCMVNIPQFQPGVEVPIKIHPTDATRVVLDTGGLMRE